MRDNPTAIDIRLLYEMLGERDVLLRLAQDTIATQAAEIARLTPPTDDGKKDDKGDGPVQP